jgi:serine protease
MFRRHLTSLLLAAAVIAAVLPAAASARTGEQFRSRDSSGRPLAHAADFPDDPGRGHGWRSVQWNFTGPFGVNAPGAWSNLFKVQRPGGRGVVVAVLDSGIAYRSRGHYKRSPDLLPKQFVPGYDFVDNDKSPLDELGHGTHVASTIAERTNNGRDLTGLAYGVKLMPVRILDSSGEGDADVIARGVRFAVKHHADIINLSLEFTTDVTAGEIPKLLAAIAYAHRKGVLVVAAAGNDGDDLLAYPARERSVLSVGATTEHGCLSAFSNQGTDLDLVAPGGGPDANLPEPNCHPNDRAGRNISQLTFMSRTNRRFGVPTDYAGTSMAVPHVAATAALIIASGVIGPHPTPDAIQQRLQLTARDLGPVGPDTTYGYGLIDAAAATSALR